MSRDRCQLCRATSHHVAHELLVGAHFGRDRDPQLSTVTSRDAKCVPITAGGVDWAANAPAWRHRRICHQALRSGVQRDRSDLEAPIHLTEVVPAGPKAGDQARGAHPATSFLTRSASRTRATVGQLLDRWLQVLDVDPSTRRSYVGYIGKHIRPALGSLPMTRLDVEP
jgi:hypothetical protein